VLVPLDGSDLSEHALEPARWLAAQLGTEVHTVVVGFIDDRRWYESYLQSLRRRWPQIVPHYVGGFDAATGIAGVAGRLPRPIVCMGTHGRSRTAAMVGSTFTEVARTIREPIVAIGAHATAPGQDTCRVVACIDGTPTSEQILPFAAGWALRLGAQLDIVAVVEPAAPLPTHAPHHRPSPLLDPTAYVSALAGRFEPCGVDAAGYVAFDPLGPEQGLADHLQARPAGLVATTSHLRTRFDRVVHGSAAARIIHTCPVPVLVQPAMQVEGRP
jgi:nucleotide-binding universal stress UspA family protein